MAAKWHWGVALLWFGPAGMAFQSPGGDGVAVRARAKHERQLDPGEAPRAELRVDAALVEVPVHVTTLAGQTVTNLKPENFRVLEDGVEQKITYFTQEDAPLSVGLLFDASSSMQKKIGKSTEAAAAFVRTANSQDEFFLVEFSDKPKLAVPFTMSPEAIYKRIARMRPFGRTALLDAIHMALLQMKSAKNSRKAIVIVSDGGDNRSRYTAGEVKTGMLESDVQLYAMGIFDWPALRSATRPGVRVRSGLPAEERNGPRLLDELAQVTGGRHYPVEDLDDLAATAERMSRDLRTEYVLGYSPSNASRDGRYRRIQLDVAAGEKLRADYRRGYYAPAQ
jgi:Ca-activated chloride channel homolog